MTKPQEKNQEPEQSGVASGVTPDVEADAGSTDTSPTTDTVTLVGKDGTEVEVRKPSADYSNLRFGYGYKEKS